MSRGNMLSSTTTTTQTLTPTTPSTTTNQMLLFELDEQDLNDDMQPFSGAASALFGGGVIDPTLSSFYDALHQLDEEEHGLEDDVDLIDLGPSTFESTEEEEVEDEDNERDKAQRQTGQGECYRSGNANQTEYGHCLKGGLNLRTESCRAMNLTFSGSPVYLVSSCLSTVSCSTTCANGAGNAVAHFASPVTLLTSCDDDSADNAAFQVTPAIQLIDDNDNDNVNDIDIDIDMDNDNDADVLYYENGNQPDNSNNNEINVDNGTAQQENPNLQLVMEGSKLNYSHFNTRHHHYHPHSHHNHHHNQNNNTDQSGKYLQEGQQQRQRFHLSWYEESNSNSSLNSTNSNSGSSSSALSCASELGAPFSSVNFETGTAAGSIDVNEAGTTNQTATTMTMRMMLDMEELNDDAHLMTISTKSLNRLKAVLPASQFDYLKKRRRTLKNRQYARGSRSRRLMNSARIKGDAVKLTGRIRHLEAELMRMKCERDFYRVRARGGGAGQGGGGGEGGDIYYKNSVPTGLSSFSQSQNNRNLRKASFATTRSNLSTSMLRKSNVAPASPSSSGSSTT